MVFERDCIPGLGRKKPQAIGAIGGRNQFISSFCKQTQLSWAAMCAEEGVVSWHIDRYMDRLPTIAQEALVSERLSSELSWLGVSDPAVNRSELH
jgi:hypothetical protein